jgi:thiol-disulfide isomerase/thioredoxin
MIKKLEVIILSLLFLLFCYSSLNGISDFSFPSLIYRITGLISAAALLFVTIYHLFPLLKGSVKKYLFQSLGLFIITYLINGLLFIYVQTKPGYDYELTLMIHPVAIQSVSSSLLFFLILGNIYSFFKHLIISRNFKLLKRITAFTTAIIIAAGLGFFIKYQIDVNYQGNENIRFIKQKYSSLDEILELPQFKNKVVYVDLWYTSCTPCIRQFQYLPQLKNELKDQEVEYLYLANETSHPNSKQRWKNFTKKFNLQGWHFYMEPAFSEQLWQTILPHQNEKTNAFYPQYLLVDKSGKIVSYNAKEPSTGEEIVKDIKALTNPQEVVATVE